MKKEILLKIKQLAESHKYIAQIDISKLKNNLVQQLRINSSKYDIKCLKSKINLFKKVLPIPKGNNFTFWSNSKVELIRFLRQNSITSYSYYNEKDRAQEDIIINKGNLRLKAGSILSLFEKYGSIKLTKGMIELLSDIVIARKDEIIGSEGSKILQLLNKKIKLNQSKISFIYDLSEGKIYSSQFIRAISNQDIEDTVKDIILKLSNTSKYSFNSTIPRKIARIIQSIKTLD